MTISTPKLDSVDDSALSTSLALVLVMEDGYYRRQPRKLGHRRRLALRRRSRQLLGGGGTGNYGGGEAGGTSCWVAVSATSLKL